MITDAFLWQYDPEDGNYLGWHLSFGNSFYVKLMNDIGTNCLQDKGSVKYKLSPAVNGKVYITGCKSKVSLATDLEFLLDSNLDNPIVVDATKGIVLVSCNAVGVNDLLHGIQRYQDGNWDFNIGKKKNSIWFWPHQSG